MQSNVGTTRNARRFEVRTAERAAIGCEHRLPENLAGCALFMDVDGTLLELRLTPQEVRAPRAVLRLIEHVSDRLDGALALISGRTIPDLDRIFHPLRIPSAGIHGAQLRGTDGRTSMLLIDRALLDAARLKMERFAQAHPGAYVEDKGAALALHTRGAPDAMLDALDLVASLADATAGSYCVVAGKCVAELRPADAHKGLAIEAFMAEPPFAGRTPIMVGDDLTDEDAFRVVLAMGGIAIAVGARASDAACRIANPRECRRWLARASGFTNAERAP
jgi:trehalose 6-phosphate phosphatase